MKRCKSEGFPYLDICLQNCTQSRNICSLLGEWTLKQTRFDRYFFISPRRCWLFSFGGFSTCLHTELALLAGQTGWKSTKTEKWPSSRRNKKITVVTILLKLSKQLYPYLGYVLQLKNLQRTLEIFLERTCKEGTQIVDAPSWNPKCQILTISSWKFWISKI